MTTKRVVYFLMGLIFLLLGGIGAFLPVLPTTPFVICAAFCFSKSSPKFEHWLKYKSIFGPSILAWEKNRSIPIKIKRFAFLMMAISFVAINISDAVFAVKLVGSGILIASAVYVYKIPSR